MTQLIINNAIQCARLVKKEDPYSYISNFTPCIYWMNELHNLLVKTGELKDFRTLDTEKKLSYWKAVQKTDKGRYMKIGAVIAAYMYDELKKIENEENSKKL